MAKFENQNFRIGSATIRNHGEEERRKKKKRKRNKRKIKKLVIYIIKYLYTCLICVKYKIIKEN